MNTALDDICFDESEQLIYKSGMLDDTRLRVNDFLQDRYCLVYTSDDAAEPKYCVSINCQTLMNIQKVVPKTKLFSNKVEMIKQKKKKKKKKK